MTAEYGMLPRSTHTRTDREAARGRQSGRTQEIQRLIGRSLRAVTDLEGFGERQITVDCDVLKADGGTRTAAITGAWVALFQAFEWLIEQGEIDASPLTDQVAAVSCGLYGGETVLDLDYAEDSACQADANFVLSGDGGLIEVQATAEERPFTERQFDELLALAKKGIGELCALQRAAIGQPTGVTGRVTPSSPFPIASELVIASHNAGKVREIGELLAPAGVSAVSAADLGLPEPEETADSFAGNALLKARAAAAASGRPALADDSGLTVRALDGEPGIYSARWAGPARDFALAMERVNRALGDAADRRASFVCALAVARPDGAEAVFEGTVSGHLTWPPRGSRGFGYDPIFVPDGHTLTFGEMTPEAKHAMSHRADAFAKLRAAA